MPLFALHCLDRPHATTLRAETRPAHLDYVRAQAAEYRFGAYLLDEGGAMCGSLMAVECADLAAARRFSANDPYTLAKLFARIDIHEWPVGIDAP
ncbi:YciI family protein [Caulobacter sp. DWR2-3-1b2]|uniref:YciI family protein n=1 Tax=unclassified Caulobacter TaxID=2648921 RepID=UPI003CF1CAD0